jgi:hypothetical protein
LDTVYALTKLLGKSLEESKSPGNASQPAA